MTVWIGTSGWNYRHWRNRFYPTGLSADRWLEHYAARFRTVELNASFYRLPDRRTFLEWRREVPEDFVVAVKASRYLTHVKRLVDPEEPVRRLLAAAGGLGPRLGPILLQLPPTLRCDPERLARTLGALSPGCRVAVETRHESWHDDRIRSLLEDHDAAWVLVDPADRSRPRWRTASWGYVRFHHGTGSPPSCYTRSPLDTWARKLAGTWASGEDVYCYFNNDGGGCAPRDARRFAAAVARAGLQPSRVPGAHETPVA